MNIDSELQCAHRIQAIIQKFPSLLTEFSQNFYYIWPITYTRPITMNH